uniref:Uncharacterized protein n=1 Tax=Amphora coffeiformis TaxID=265554 RepID=A0A7S3LF22_9STRA
MNPDGESEYYEAMMDAEAKEEEEVQPLIPGFNHPDEPDDSKPDDSKKRKSESTSSNKKAVKMESWSSPSASYTKPAIKPKASTIKPKTAVKSKTAAAKMKAPQASSIDESKKKNWLASVVLGMVSGVGLPKDSYLQLSSH